MAMTNTNMAPAVPKNTPPPAKPLVEDDPLTGVKEAFDAEATAVAKKVEAASVEVANVAELLEEDAYNLNIPINAGAKYDPNTLKIILKDKRYVARWCHKNAMRQTMVASQGFSALTIDDVENPETLRVFTDAQGHLAWADLIAMKIPKDIYYAGIRRAYTQSLHASSNKRAAEAGAARATSELQGSLSASERAYMANHSESFRDKPIYNPNIGV